MNQILEFVLLDIKTISILKLYIQPMYMFVIFSVQLNEA